MKITFADRGLHRLAEMERVWFVAVETRLGARVVTLWAKLKIGARRVAWAALFLFGSERVSARAAKRLELSLQSQVSGPKSGKPHAETQRAQRFLTAD